LGSTLDLALSVDDLTMQLDTAAGLAWIDDFAREREGALEHCQFILETWRGSEDRHYAVWGLRHASSVFATNQDAAGVHACAEALSRISADTGHPDALAALAHALGEAALLEHDADAAVEQFFRANALHSSLE